MNVEWFTSIEETIDGINITVPTPKIDISTGESKYNSEEVDAAKSSLMDAKDKLTGIYDSLSSVVSSAAKDIALLTALATQPTTPGEVMEYAKNLAKLFAGPMATYTIQMGTIATKSASIAAKTSAKLDEINSIQQTIGSIDPSMIAVPPLPNVDTLV